MKHYSLAALVRLSLIVASGVASDVLLAEEQRVLSGSDVGVNSGLRHTTAAALTTAAGLNSADWLGDSEDVATDSSATATTVSNSAGPGGGAQGAEDVATDSSATATTVSNSAGPGGGARGVEDVATDSSATATTVSNSAGPGGGAHASSEEDVSADSSSGSTGAKRANPKGEGAAHEVSKEKQSTEQADTSSPAYCAAYLCGSTKKNPSAEAYIAGGCEGSFSSFLKSEMEELVSESSPTSRSSTVATVQDGVSTFHLVGIAGLCGVAAMVVGFVAGSREVGGWNAEGDVRAAGYEPVAFT